MVLLIIRMIGQGGDHDNSRNNHLYFTRRGNHRPIIAYLLICSVAKNPFWGELMLTTIKHDNEKWRLINTTTNEIALYEDGQPVDGGGYDTSDEAKQHMKVANSLWPEFDKTLDALEYHLAGLENNLDFITQDLDRLGCCLEEAVRKLTIVQTIVETLREDYE